MKWKTKTRQFLLAFLLCSFALALFSFTTPITQATTNLAPMPYGWVPKNEHQGAPQFIFVDYGVTHNGNPSLRVERDTYGERDGFVKEPNFWIRIAPMDHIVFKCWMKLTVGDGSDNKPYDGARLGIDFYDNFGRLGSTESPNGAVDGEGETDEDRAANWVNWGTTTWVQRKIEFNVPSTVGGQTPTGMIPWLQAMPYLNTGYAWFADCELYVNPPEEPVLSFNDDFGSGSLSAWTSTYTSGGGTATILALAQRSTEFDETTLFAQSRIRFSYALDANLPATAGAYAAIVKTFASSYSTLFAQSRIQFSALPTSGNHLSVSPAICDVDNNDLVAVHIYNNNGTYQWALKYRTNAVARNWVFSSTPTPTVNTWYNIEVKFVGGVGTGEARLWVNGVERCAITGLTNNDPLAQQVQVGASTYASGALAVHVYTDSVLVDSIYIEMGNITREL